MGAKADGGIRIICCLVQITAINPIRTIGINLDLNLGIPAIIIANDGYNIIAAGTNGGGGLRVARIPAELAGMLLTAAGTNGGGLIVATIPNELAIMLFTAFDGENWSFREPLRPPLSLPLMAVATRAATAKHATVILMGVDKVMVERSDAESIECENYD